MSYSEGLTKELNDALQHKVAAGDEAARQRMIEGNMRLAAYKVEVFLTERPQFQYLKDDLLSEAFLGLTEGVNQIRDKGAGENPTGLLAICIEKQLLSAVKGAGTIRTPRRSEHAGPGVSRLNSDSLAHDPSTERDTREQIDACCTTDEERAVVAYREEGYDDTEIAAATGLSRWKVGRIRKRLAEKYSDA